MQLAVSCHSLDRDNLGAIGLSCEHRAGLHRNSVYQNRAGTTDTGVATHMRAGQPRDVADEVSEEKSRFDLFVVARPVDRYAYTTLHKRNSLCLFVEGRNYASKKEPNTTDSTRVTLFRPRDAEAQREEGLICVVTGGNRSLRGTWNPHRNAERKFLRLSPTLDFGLWTLDSPSSPT